MNWRRALRRFLQPFAPEEPVWTGFDLGRPEGDKTAIFTVGESQWEDDDEFHKQVTHGFWVLASLGQIDVDHNMAERYRISWICSKCSKVHFQHGSLVQITDTYLALVQMGYPWIKIENAAMVEMAAVEGIDQSDPGAMAQAYKEFLSATRD